MNSFEHNDLILGSKAIAKAYFMTLTHLVCMQIYSNYGKQSTRLLCVHFC